MKFIEFQFRIKKIMICLSITLQNYENHEIHRIPCQNHENHAKFNHCTQESQIPRIPRQNNANQ